MNIAKKIRQQSKEILSGHWVSALSALFVLLLFIFADFSVYALFSCLFLAFKFNEILSFSVMIIAVLAVIVLTSPVINGYLKFHYNLSLSKEPDVSNLLDFFKNGRYFKTVTFNISLFFRSLLPLQIIGILLFTVLFIMQNSIIIKILDAFLIVLNILYVLTELVRLSTAEFLYIDNPDEDFSYYFKIAKTINKYHYHNNIKLTLSFMPWIALCYFVLPGFYVIPYFATSLATSAKWLIKLYKDGKIL